MPDVTYVEPTFGVDEFRKPKVLTGREAITQSILTVLFGKPGFYPSIPDLGMNIQKYRYVRVDDLDPDIIKAQLAYQCRAVYPGVLSDQIEVFAQRVNGITALAIIIPVEEEEAEDESNVVISLQMNEDQIEYNYELLSSAMLNMKLGRT